MRDFFSGAGVLFAGFTWWRRRPGAMALGLVPALIAAVLLTAALTALGAGLPWMVTASTPFAEAWAPFWRDALRWALALAAFGGSLVLAVVSFTAITLVIGDPFYERIWRAVEHDLGGEVPTADYPFWRTVGDGLRLVGLGVVAAFAAAVVGLVPVLGGVLGFLTGLVLAGRLLADELLSRPLTARGLDRHARRALLRRHRARALGFGIAAQACFLVPFGAVVVMPVAVAASTALAREVLDSARREALSGRSAAP